MEVMVKFVKYKENSHGNQALIHSSSRFKKTKVNLRDPRVQKLIEKITPFYTLEAIRKFRDKVNKRVAQAEGIEIIERKKALKNTVKSFEVVIFLLQKIPESSLLPLKMLSLGN